jgi:hypothetical protein
MNISGVGLRDGLDDQVHGGVKVGGHMVGPLAREDAGGRNPRHRPGVLPIRAGDFLSGGEPACTTYLVSIRSRPAVSKIASSISCSLLDLFGRAVSATLLASLRKTVDQASGDRRRSARASEPVGYS